MPLDRSERVYRRLMRAYPSRFRTRFTDEMVQLFGDQLREARVEGPSGGVAGVWLRGVRDLAISSVGEHVRRDRTVAHSLSAPPSTASRVLGFAGILGGALLLVALVVEIGPDLNALRLILLNAGAMAIVFAVHRRHGAAAPTLALTAAVPALIANGWSLAMTILAVGQPQPAAGAFGLIGFYAAVAMWLSNAFFGLVTVWIGVVARWGALAMAIGSLLALAGIDRFGLVSPETPTIWGALALAGVGLTGIGWILLGLDVATARRGPVDDGRRVRLRE